MNDLLIKALITVMIIDAGMHFYYDYKKNTYQSLKFLILTVLMAVSVGAALTKQETDNVQQRMKIIEQKIEMQEEGKEPEEDGTNHEMRVHGDAAVSYTHLMEARKCDICGGFFSAIYSVK